MTTYEVWKKDDLRCLSEKDKDMWFDVLNHGLEEDRGYRLDDPDLIHKQKEIKASYIAYLESCITDDLFLSYYVLRNSHRKIISLCRVIKRNGSYTLEGLETHRDDYRKGYASKLIDLMIGSLYGQGIEELYANVSKDNLPSLNLHKKLGFAQIDCHSKQIRFSLNLKKYLKIKLFNDWANTYHDSVKKSERDGTYPFAGYSDIQFEIIDTIARHPKASVLDMGIGTGEITGPLYDMGFLITGVDFSSQMIGLASSRMPKAKMIESDFLSLVGKLKCSYDFIIFNYSIHHLDYDKQIMLINELYDKLNKDGMILIGDVSCKDEHTMQGLKIRYEKIWDDEEFYPILNHYLRSDKLGKYKIIYKKFSHVSGLITLYK